MKNAELSQPGINVCNIASLTVIIDRTCKKSEKTANRNQSSCGCCLYEYDQRGRFLLIQNIIKIQIRMSS